MLKALRDHPYLVEAGTPVSLKTIDASDDSLFPVGKTEGKELLKPFTEELGRLQKIFYAQNRHKLLLVLQGMDTGGKDGTVKDVFDDVDPQGLRVVSFKKPTELEMSYDYLWRIHAEVPCKGELVVFNRSHYEDIIAARVRAHVPQKVWKKRYDHINHFEQMLTDEGCTIVKIFLHISKDEQKERLQSRLDRPDKHWKFDPADLSDRAFWDEYQAAYEEVLKLTSTSVAPWFVVPANRKWHRNLAVAELLVKTLTELDPEYPKVGFDPREIEID